MGVSLWLAQQKRANSAYGAATAPAIRRLCERWDSVARLAIRASGHVPALRGRMAHKAVSAMLRSSRPKPNEILGIGGEIGNPGIDHVVRTLGQRGKARTTTRFPRSFDDEPQPLLDQIPKIALSQRRLRLGSTVVRDFNSGFD